MLTSAQHDLAAAALLRLRVARADVVAQLVTLLGEAAAPYYANLDEAAAWRTLLDLLGTQLLAGGTTAAKQRRALLLERLATDRLGALARLGRDSFEIGGEQIAPHHIARLAKRPWRGGSVLAKALTSALDLPEVFAGVDRASMSTLPQNDFRAPPPLKPFQQTLASQLLDTLRARQRPFRAILSLPTGGGKTRTAGDALITLLAEHRLAGRDDAYYLWLAQSEELCEQAVLCLQQLWAHQWPGEPICVHRYFGGRHVATAAFRPGIVVATIQQLTARLQAPGAIEATLLEQLAAIVIDEAHRATSASYTKLFATVAEVNPRRERLPIVGLTATPGRARGETNDLIRTFGDRLLLPDLSSDTGEDQHPLTAFRERGYLAWPDHELVVTDYRVTTAEPRSRAAHEWLDFEVRVQQELGRAHRRNQLIVQRLMEIPTGIPTLVYACSVEHVRVLHVLLRRAGRTCGYLTGETNKLERAGLVDAFRQNELDFLVNYGVLTTGFDAPATGCIALTRPISSEVLYEQIVGRGLRGVAFGGTERCLILDFEDNYRTFGDQLAYHRFGRFWAQARRVTIALEQPLAELPTPVKKAKRRKSKGVAGPTLFG